MVLWLIKKAYDVRSTIVHESSLKGKSEDLIDISKDLDVISRKFTSLYPEHTPPFLF